MNGTARGVRVVRKSFRPALAERVMALPRFAKILIAGVLDVAAVVIALLGVRYLVHPQATSAINGHLGTVVAIGALAAVAGCWTSGAYFSVTRFADSRLLVRTSVGALLSALAVAVACVFFGVLEATWNLVVVYALVCAFLLGAWRIMGARALHSGSHPGGQGEKVIIYGAGMSGRQLAAALRSGGRFYPIAFIDDSIHLQGRMMYGLRTYSLHDIDMLKERGAQRVLLAMPSVSLARRKQILEMLEKTALKVMVVPGVEELADGRKRVDELREVQIEDLLGRDPVRPDAELMHAFISGQVILITGGGGSIGSELARQALRLHASKLILMDISEYALYEIDHELRRIQKRSSNGIARTEIVPVLGSVLDRDLLQRVMTEHKVDTLYHAAAYKHVPLVEANPLAGIRNNLFGTRCTVEAAAECGVHHFVLISTDKAVRPTNVMGATKRAAELVVQRVAASNPDMRTSIVRFGNVLASSGSVIPLFKRQLAEGGPITVTHPNVTRYFMTIPEAVELVIQAGAMGRRGEIFLLEMGEPVKIVDLAKRLIHLSGMRLLDSVSKEGDIEIRFTGLRPGEKMIEELLVDGDSSPTAHPRIFLALDKGVQATALEAFISKIAKVVDQGRETDAAELAVGFAQHEFVGAAAVDDEGDSEDLVVSDIPRGNVISLREMPVGGS